LEPVVGRDIIFERSLLFGFLPFRAGRAGSVVLTEVWLRSTDRFSEADRWFKD
jgi:hypothetical protein